MNLGGPAPVVATPVYLLRRRVHVGCAQPGVGPFEHDADQAHEDRMESARHDLQIWGRWVVQRVDGGGGYGASVLANMERTGRSADHYEAPIVEAHCSWVDDIVTRMGEPWRMIAVLHYGRGLSYNWIARNGKMAPATVSRRIDEIERAVAYPKQTAPSLS